MAEFGQGKELQLLALGEGDELVHEFGRDSLIGDTSNGPGSLLVGLSNVGSNTLSGLFGSTSGGFSSLASIIAALAVSAEGFFTQSSTAGLFEGSGTELTRPFTLEIFDNIGSAISTGKLWFESTLQQFGSVIGLDIDDQAITQTVEDVVSLLFPHLPVQAMPSLIHNILTKASSKPSATPLATDQAMENYDADAWIANAGSEFEVGSAFSAEAEEIVAVDTQNSATTTEDIANWVIARETELADQLVGILAAGNSMKHRSGAVTWNTSPESRPAAPKTTSPVPARMPNVVTMYDGTKRFGRAVPKILVPPVGALPKRPLAGNLKPGVKSAHSGSANSGAAIAAAAAIGALGIAGYVKAGPPSRKICRWFVCLKQPKISCQTSGGPWLNAWIVTSRSRRMVFPICESISNVWELRFAPPCSPSW